MVCVLGGGSPTFRWVEKFDHLLAGIDSGNGNVLSCGLWSHLICFRLLSPLGFMARDVRQSHLPRVGTFLPSRDGSLAFTARLTILYLAPVAAPTLFFSTSSHQQGHNHHNRQHGKSPTRPSPLFLLIPNQGQKVNCNPLKLTSIVSYLQRTRTVHSIKELEKVLPSVASINGMQVKGLSPTHSC